MTVFIPEPEGSDLPPVGPTTTEMVVQRRQTLAFILRQPVVVTLVPRLRAKTARGGATWEDQPPRAPQTMTLIEPGAIPLPVVTQDGIQREVEFELLGEWDAVIGERDVFEHDGRQWEVLQLAFANGWEQRALVSRRG